MPAFSYVTLVRLVSNQEKCLKLLVFAQSRLSIWVLRMYNSIIRNGKEPVSLSALHLKFQVAQHRPQNGLVQLGLMWRRS
jgi:hypothetical protein